MKKVYLFDLDGTLVDSMPSWIQSATGYLDERGIAYSPNLIKDVVALGLLGVARYYKEQLKIEETVEEFMQTFKERTRVKYEREISAKSGVIETLKTLRARGEKLNVLTASPHVFLDPCLKRLGVYDLFDNVFSSDDFTAPKSEPALYGEVASRLGVRAQDCIMVDDSLAVHRAAKEAGVITVGVYDEYSANCEKELRALCHRYVHTLEELL